ncbi:MAG: hypothetical protein JXB08_05440 [Bacilli bacterium]|nr:hypothetical protein [Bacilli bacterium]MBN2876878.1 hypothetical protein [Bacilli bacterium]
MINQSNIETLFDCFDASCTLIYETYKLPYLDGMIITCENIMANSVEDKYQEIKPQLEEIISTVSSIEFQPEEIRKAFQFACLRGFKHASITNQMMTPETIGVFIHYLVTKLYLKQDLQILDPLVGVGNLITSIANNLDGETSLVGVDSDNEMYRLAAALFDILGYGDQVYFQDTLTFRYPESDLMVTDTSGLDADTIYNIIGYHASNIISGGFLIGVFDEQTVDPNILIEKSEKLKHLWKLFGMVNLPESLTNNQKKSIVLFQREGEDVIQPNRFLLVDLPDFNNQKEMKHVINQLNDWFQNTEFYKI